MDDLFDSLKYIPKYFKVIDKNSHLVPMVLFPAQEYYIANKSNRNVCLKNRQTGFSTGVMADNAHALFTQEHGRQTLITHDQETSEFLFQTVQRFHKNLPPSIRPTLGWKAGSRMSFPKLDSYIYIDSAKSDAIGIGHTLTRVHLSEVSKWSASRALQLFTDISQTVPLTGNAVMTVESTPKGRVGLFPDLYNGAKNGDNPYKAFFFPWWWDVTCLLDAIMTDKFIKPEYLERCAIKLNISLQELDNQEKNLRELQHLTDNQVAFRRYKILEIGELFFQEYPENDIDCWMAGVSGAIDAATLKRYWAEIREGKLEGELTIWKDHRGDRTYKIGVDVAAGVAKGDYSVASVVDNRNMEYVARLRGRIEPDLFADLVFELGRRYGNAEIGVEKTGHGHSVIRILLERNYPNLYTHVDYDEITKMQKHDYGWKTTLKSKPLMINYLRSAMRSGDLISYSENLLNEAASLDIVDDKVVKVGYYDDEWDALSIALQMREAMDIFEEEGRHAVTNYV